MRADRGQIEQVLLNLAVNARDAMPDGGTLTIATMPVEVGAGYTRRHRNLSTGSYVELTVSDTGTGMPASVADHIFEPFFTTKPAGEGTGLGLATVYGIVAEARGSVSVDSEEGMGTTFRLYFPVAGAPAVPAPTGTSTAPRGGGETILVVEDEPAVLELTARILRQSGYAVLEAATFQDALAQAAGHDFQLLLTDSVMPHMSGSTLAGRVERAATRPARPLHVRLQRRSPRSPARLRRRSNRSAKAVQPTDIARTHPRDTRSTYSSRRSAPAPAGEFRSPRR